MGVQKGVLETMGPSPKMAEHEITFSVGPKLRGRLVLTSCGTTWNTLVLRAKSCGVTDRSADHLV